MLTQNDIARLSDADVYGSDGDKIGSVGQVYLDTDSGEPEWVTVKTGLFGTKETFVPLQRASVSDGRLTVAVAKNVVKDAPRIDTDGALDHTEENELYRYYGLHTGGADSGSSTNESGRGYDSSSSANSGSSYESGSTYATGNSDRSERYTETAGTTGTSRRDGDDDAMTRSEERLVAGTRTEEAGKARLRKYVVTEQEQVTVPVSREEVRLEREPITDANRGDAFDGADITEAEHEVTLRAERAVVDTEAVPVERVRLGKETVTDEETVSGEVRKEQIEFDGPETNRNR